MGNDLWKTTSAVLGVLGGIGSALTVLVFAFYILLERETIRTAFLALVPPRHQKRIGETATQALLTMGGWLRGQTILALAMMTLISIAMAALGVPHPILIGIVGGIGELIPMVGPIVAGFVAVPVAFFTMPLWVGIVTIVFFVVLSTVEGNLIVPKVMQKNVELSPFFTVVAVLVGVTLSGLVGALLAIPLASALRVVLKSLVVPAIQKRRPSLEK
jgi:predicted PurR-regulated permease PerM